MLNDCTHLVVGVANDRRAPGADIIHVLVAIHIPSMRTLDAVKHDWLPANRFESSHRGVYPSGHQLLVRVQGRHGV